MKQRKGNRKKYKEKVTQKRWRNEKKRQNKERRGK